RPADAPPAFAVLDFVDAELPYHQVPDDYLARFTPGSRRELGGVSAALMTETFSADHPAGAETVEAASAMYDAGVAYVDHLLGRIVDALRRRGTLDRTILVVASDHCQLPR